eukprot:1186549-Prorocentrum_minimum.AAC.1
MPKETPVMVRGWHACDAHVACQGLAYKPWHEGDVEGEVWLRQHSYEYTRYVMMGKARWACQGLPIKAALIKYTRVLLDLTIVLLALVPLHYDYHRMIRFLPLYRCHPGAPEVELERLKGGAAKAKDILRLRLHEEARLRQWLQMAAGNGTSPTQPTTVMLRRRRAEKHQGPSESDVSLLLVQTPSPSESDVSLLYQAAVQ